MKRKVRKEHSCDIGREKDMTNRRSGKKSWRKWKEGKETQYGKHEKKELDNNKTGYFSRNKEMWGRRWGNRSRI